MNLIAKAAATLAALTYMDDDLFALPRQTRRVYYEEPQGEDLARAKGLTRYLTEDNKFIYARNEKEALKRARKRGYGITKIHLECDTE